MQVWNIATILGLKDRMNTYVGDHMIRGISGGEKRRASIGINHTVRFVTSFRRDVDATRKMFEFHGRNFKRFRCFNNL